MSDANASTSRRPDASPLPADVAARLNGQLGDAPVLAWAEFDLDGDNRYAAGHVLLTDTALLIVWPAGVESIAIAGITDTRVVEGLGVDLLVIVDERGHREIHYSRRFRRDVTRLHRKLQRRLPDKDGKSAERPPWLEAAERSADVHQRCEKCGGFIPAYAENVCPQCSQSRKILWRLLDVAKPYRKKLWIALALTIFHAFLMATPGVVQKMMIDRALGTGEAGYRIRQLLMWSGAFVVVIVLSEVVGGMRMALLSIVGTNVTSDLRHGVYAHLHDLSLRFFAKRRTGSLITRVTNDTERLWDFIAFGSVNVVRDMLMIVVVTGVMLYMNWRLALITLAPLPLIAGVTWWRGTTMQKMFGRLWTYWSRMSAVVGDSMGGVKVVKAFASENREVARFDARNIEYTAKEQEVNRVWWQLQPFVSGVMRIGSLVVWIVGGYMVIRNPSPANSVGTLVAFQFYVWQFYGPINELANSSRMVTRAASSAQRVFEVLDTAPEIYSRRGALKKDRLDGRIELRHVGFSYEGAQPALRDVSVTVEPGQMVGLCGHSGAGKSTFVNLLCRFYDVTDGQLLIDGADIRDYDLRWLRQQIGMVLQEPYLFHGTISENVRYGRPEASDLEVIEAARAANAHDFIVGFPDGYDTMVGERGQSLSGGERQRVSIARAILHNPRILILDEATSSLDTETERQIQEALDRLVEGRTTIAIAHRLSTLRTADRLVVLDKGKVVEEGTHAELVDRPDGAYAKLFKTQMEMNEQYATA